jgi:hypothetical protein
MWYAKFIFVHHGVATFTCFDFNLCTADAHRALLDRQGTLSVVHLLDLDEEITSGTFISDI